MRYHVMKSNDIRKNLATEEYLMNTVDVEEPLFLLYIQSPCIIIGRNQNAYEEINLTYLRENNITLTRRTSGGGAVYDDLGNISFSFVTKKDATVFGDYHGVTTPILRALHEMGAKDAEVGGRNDLYINGMKFSGNAMYTKKGRTYSHGTLMFDVDLTVLDKVLTVSKEKIESKATKSVRKSVTNVKPFLDDAYQNLTTEAFGEALLRHVYQVDSIKDIADKELILSQEQKEGIEELFEKRYANDEWVYGSTPNFDFHRRTRLPKVGIVDVYISTEHGKISAIQFMGDFFGSKDISELEKVLKGTLYKYENIKEALLSLDVSDYILNFTNQEFIDLMMK
ncbi:MAG TPA: lipoate--protein ligase [Candidatus Tetragenococcus pullicola]|nr:lipoate--protein ligase [Candidatus Tetragenococcus pullicola]